jgi:hypothetical protein
VSQTQEQLIADTLKETGGNLSKTARLLGLNYGYVLTRYNPNLSPLTTAKGPEPEDIRSLGRPGKQQYVIAIKRAGYEWPEKFADVLSDAREKFDAGTHEMFQTSENGWVVQYLIPRKVKTHRRYFFRTLEF